MDRQKWEYTSVYESIPDTQLDFLGESGWELCGVSGPRMIFKRPKCNPSQVCPHGFIKWGCPECRKDPESKVKNTKGKS